MATKKKQKTDMKNMYFYILLFINLLSIAEGGMENFNSDLSSQSFGCLEKTQVTVFVPRFPYYLGLNVMSELNEHLSQTNCHFLFMFLKDVRKSVPFQNNVWVKELDVKEHNTILSNREIVTIIEDETFADDPNLRQTLLLIQDAWDFPDDVVLKALEKFDNKINRDIILYCHYNNCPVEHNIPFHRIVPDFNLTKDTSKKLIDLVKNPNFNKFENLKYYRLFDERLKCLRNKTVHIQLAPPSITLLESFLILAYNTKEFSTRIIYYNDNGGDQYLRDFEKHFGSEGRLTMVLGYYDISKKRFEHFSQNTDDIYLVPYSYHFHEMPKFCRLPLQGRKAFVYYNSIENVPKECWDRFERVTLKEIDFYIRDYYRLYSDDAFITEDVLEVSCF